MRIVLFSTVVIASVVWMGIAPAKATGLSMPGIGNTNIHVVPVEKAGYRRRYWRRYGYPVPYAYYPPGYGYYVFPSEYAYPPGIGYYPPQEDGYAEAPPAEGDYGDTSPSEGDYADTPPPEGEYAEPPPSEGY